LSSSLRLRIPCDENIRFIGSKIRSHNEIQIPGERLARVNQSLKRRLDDDVEEVFSRTCASNDLESAADLLNLLEKWHARRSASYGRERRISGANLVRARKELERLSALRGVAPAVEADQPAGAPG
jgi:hypothetical protein